MQYGVINFKVREGPFGLHEVTGYRTKGGPYFLAECPDRTYKPGDVVHIGPFRFRYVAFAVQYLADILVLDNPLALPRVWRYWTKQYARNAYHRLILTLYVWGLAEHHRAAVPSWRDVPFLRRVAAVDWWPNGHAWEGV